MAVGPTKTRRSRRLVSIDGETAAALRAHRKAQLEERLMFGADYHDGDFVFCRVDGAPFHPDRLTQLFGEHCRAAGLPYIKLHGLRHPRHADAAGGRYPKVVQERLGHSSIAITLDTYSQRFPPCKRTRLRSSPPSSTAEPGTSPAWTPQTRGRDS